jgi:hypothetical protein
VLDVVNLEENKESQLALANLQKDAKVYLILSVGAASFFGLLVVNFLILSIYTNSPFQKDSFLIGSTFSAVLGLGFTAFFVIKMRSKQEEIKELKKKY